MGASSRNDVASTVLRVALTARRAIYPSTLASTVAKTAVRAARNGRALCINFLCLCATPALLLNSVDVLREGTYPL